MAKRKKNLFNRRFSLKPPPRDKSAEDQRLALLAQELGTAGMMVLINDYDFSKEQANEWLGKVIEQAKTNRLMFGVLTVTEALKQVTDDSGA